MSNLAEKLPKFVRTRVEAVGERRRKLADRIEELADQYLPGAVVAPLRTDDGLTLKTLREAASAAGDELVARVRGRKDAPDADQAEQVEAEQVEAEQVEAEQPDSEEAKAEPAPATAPEAAPKARKAPTPRKKAPAKAAAPAPEAAVEAPAPGKKQTRKKKAAPPAKA